MLDGLGERGTDSCGADPPEPWEPVGADRGLELVLTGVGKSAAGGAIGQVADRNRYRGVLSLGVAGALPGSPAGLLETVLGARSVLADEGVQTPEGFVSLAQMGLVAGPEMAIETDRAWLDRLGPLADHVGAIATVSTCSGTDPMARRVEERTGALAEAMEGAAVGLAARRLGLAFAEVRVISNTTGNRPAQRWDLPGALRVLGALAARLGDVL